jgi:hypothetical protein
MSEPLFSPHGSKNNHPFFVDSTQQASELALSFSSTELVEAVLDPNS